MSIAIKIHGQIDTIEAFNDLAAALSIMEAHTVESNGYVKRNVDTKANIAAARNILLERNMEDAGFDVEYQYTPDEGVDALVAVAKKHAIDMSFTRKWGQDGGGRLFMVRDGVETLKLPRVEGKVAVTIEIVREMAARGMASTEKLLEMMDTFEREPELPRFTIADDVVTEIVLPRRTR